MIPQASPNLRFRRYRSDILAAMEETVDSDRYVLGPAVRRFEERFAQYCNVAHCVAVNSGTDALTIALNSLGVGLGDEVITVSMTAPGTALAIRQCNALPHFVDIDPLTRCLDVRAAERAVNSRTKAILPVHLHGFPMDMAPVIRLARRYDLHVVEDCAHAHGARRGDRSVGSFGDAGAFSFYPTKNLGCIGDGGAIVTDDDLLAEQMRSARSFETQTAATRRLGLNSRLDELQASVLCVLLPHLDEVNQQRARIACRYRQALADLMVELPPVHPGFVYHQFAVACESRDHTRRRLWKKKIGTGTHYAMPLHEHPAFADCPRGRLPVTESLAGRMISLPIQPEVVEGYEDRIVAAVSEVLPGLERMAA